MSVHSFGRTRNSEPVDEIRLALPGGAQASILTLGAILRDLVVPGTGGVTRRVVLGFADLAGYEADVMHIGTTVGRCANRIKAGQFTLDGRTYRLPLNEKSRTHLHGGFRGFSRYVWTVESHDTQSVTMALTSPDGDEGYPGTVWARCVYRLLPPATLRVELSGATDAPTILNMTNHSYFTLDYGKTIHAHRLQMNASHYTPTDEFLIPTGQVAPVGGTVYEFRRPRALLHPSGDMDFMYDMSFVLDRECPGLIHAASVDCPGSPVRMEVHTDEPALQLYDASGLGPSHPGVDGKPHFRNAGLCLEAQKYPDSPNHPDWPSTVLRPGVAYSTVTEYRFLSV